MPPGPFVPTHVVPAVGMPYWAQPDANRPPDGQVEPGLPVQMVARSGGWAHVRFSNGGEAWVDGGALQQSHGARGIFSPTHRIPRAGMDARARPDAADPVVTRLQAGLAVQILTERNGWAEVRFENGWETWVDGRQLAPFGASGRQAGGRAFPVASWLPMLGATTVLSGSFLAWYSVLGSSISAWDLPIASLVDKTSTSTAPDAGWLLLVVLVVAVPLVTRRPLPRPLLGVLGAVPVVVAVLALRLYTEFPSPRPGLGSGLFLTLVGGAMIAASALVPPTV